MCNTVLHNNNNDNKKMKMKTWQLENPIRMFSIWFFNEHQKKQFIGLKTYTKQANIVHCPIMFDVILFYYTINECIQICLYAYIDFVRKQKCDVQHASNKIYWMLLFKLYSVLHQSLSLCLLIECVYHVIDAMPLPIHLVRLLLEFGHSMKRRRSIGSNKYFFIKQILCFFWRNLQTDKDNLIVSKKKI